MFSLRCELTSITGIGKRLCSICVMCGIAGIGKSTLYVLRGISDFEKVLYAM